MRIEWHSAIVTLMLVPQGVTVTAADCILLLSKLESSLINNEFPFMIRRKCTRTSLPPQSDGEPLSNAVEHHDLLAHVQAAAEEGGHKPLALQWQGQNHQIPNYKWHAE